jgi:hypothetical protein
MTDTPAIEVLTNTNLVSEIIKWLDFPEQMTLACINKAINAVMEPHIAPTRDSLFMIQLSKYPWYEPRRILITKHIKDNDSRINWDNIWCTHNLSERFIGRYAKSQKAFDLATYYQTLSENFIRRHANNINWDCVSLYYRKLSDDFFEEFADKINWRLLSMDRELTEAFIARFADRVDWKEISSYCILSERFVEAFANRIHWRIYLHIHKLSPELIKHCQVYIDHCYYQ